MNIIKIIDTVQKESSNYAIKKLLNESCFKSTKLDSIFKSNNVKHSFSNNIADEFVKKYTPAIDSESKILPFTYINAKSECIKALNSDKPYEKMFLINAKTGSTIGKISGETTKCEITQALLDKCTKDTIVLHGHPPFIDEISAPVSFQDFKLLNTTDIKKIVAFNKQGQFSSLEKAENYEKFSKKDFNQLEKTYMNALIKELPSNSKSQVKSYLTEYKKNNDKEKLSKILSIINDFQLTKDGAKATNDFWTKQASLNNLIYKTNFDFNF